MSNSYSTDKSQLQFYARLSEWLKERRESFGLSQEQMAEKLECTFQMIQKYENGKSRIPFYRLVKLCRVCATNLQEAVTAAEGE